MTQLYNDIVSYASQKIRLALLSGLMCVINVLYESISSVRM